MLVLQNGLAQVSFSFPEIMVVFCKQKCKQIFVYISTTTFILRGSDVRVLLFARIKDNPEELLECPLEIAEIGVVFLEVNVITDLITVIHGN